MKHFVVSEDELNAILAKWSTVCQSDEDDKQSIRSKIMQKLVPDDAIGFVYPSRTPDGKYTHSFFPSDWKVSQASEP